MSKTSFKLLSGVSGPFQAGPEVDVVRVPLSGHSTKTVKKKALVSPGSLVAEHDEPGVGHAHSPITGAVAAVTDEYVEITTKLPKPKKEDEEPPKPPEVQKTKLEGLTGEELEKTLNSLGVTTLGMAKPILVINGLNPEPGVTVYEHLFKEDKATLEKGLALIKDFVSPKTVYLVAAQGSGEEISGTRTVEVSPVYPNSVDELAVKAATGRELPDDAAVIGLLELWQIGRVAETGMPVTETVATVGGVDFRITVGVPVDAVLDKAGIKVEECDRVVLGGPMLGAAVDKLEAPVAKDTYGLFVIPFRAFPPVSDEQCLNCGECVLICPSRIRPNMIGRYAEFKMFEMCRQYNVDSCIECGLCAFYCTARRPLLQLIRLAKAELGLSEIEAMACFITGAEQEAEEGAEAES
jgi:electron transport complex protein RnfC